MKIYMPHDDNIFIIHVYSNTLGFIYLVNMKIKILTNHNNSDPINRHTAPRSICEFNHK